MTCSFLILSTLEKKNDHPTAAVHAQVLLKDMHTNANEKHRQQTSLVRAKNKTQTQRKRTLFKWCQIRTFKIVLNFGEVPLDSLKYIRSVSVDLALVKLLRCYINKHKSLQMNEKKLLRILLNRKKQTNDGLLRNMRSLIQCSWTLNHFCKRILA